MLCHKIKLSPQWLRDQSKLHTRLTANTNDYAGNHMQSTSTREVQHKCLSITSQINNNLMFIWSLGSCKMTLNCGELHEKSWLWTTPVQHCQFHNHQSKYRIFLPFNDLCHKYENYFLVVVAVESVTWYCDFNCTYCTSHDDRLKPAAVTVCPQQISHRAKTKSVTDHQNYGTATIKICRESLCPEHHDYITTQ